MSLQIPDYQIARPLSLIDALEERSRLDQAKQQQKLNEMKMRAAQEEMDRDTAFRGAFSSGSPSPADLYRIDPEKAAQYEKNQLGIQSGTREFIKGAATDLYNRAKLIQDPAQQQAAIDRYIQPLKPQLQKMGLPMNEPVTMDHLKMIMGSGSAEYHPPVTHAGGIAEWTPEGWRNVEINGQQLKPGQYDTGTQYNIGKAKAIANLVQQGHITPQEAESLLGGQQQAQKVPTVNWSPEKESDLIRRANQGDQSAIAEIESAAAGVKIPSASERELNTGRAKNQAELEAKAREQQFKAAQDLPNLVSQADQALKLVSELQTHPGKSGMVGMPNLSGAFGGIRGTKEASFNERLKQVQGKTFLQAFDTLKGAGAITETEGEKATSAIARLGTAQEEKEFDKALNDLKDVISTGLENAKRKAGVTSKESTNFRFKSPEEVKAAIRSGIIDRDTGINVLKSQFGME